MKFTAIIAFVISAQFGFAQSMTLALEGEAWNGVSEYPAKGRNGILINQKLTFGDFTTLMVDRSWTKGSSVTTGLSQGISTDPNYQKLITTDKIKKNQTLYFSLQDSAGLRGSAYCATNVRIKDFNIGNNPNSPINIFSDILGLGDSNSNTFYTLIYDAQATTRWELLLDNEAAQKNPKSYAGYLIRTADDYYVIKPYSKVKSKKGKVGTMPFGSAGFEIRTKDGEPVAAVSLIDNGVVYLKASNPEERMLLATVCTALLLQQQI